MAHQGLIRALGALACAAIACAPPPPPPATPTATVDHAWAKYHSARFRMSVSLPDGRAWKIDDHRRAELYATHEASHSSLMVASTEEPELMNRARCEEKARERGIVPTSELRGIEDTVTVGPEAYDTRLIVGIEAGKDARLPLRGHVLAFGSFIRHCLVFHYESAVPSGAGEQELSSRLAVAKVRILGGLALDPPRTTGNAEVLREREGREKQRETEDRNKEQK